MKTISFISFKGGAGKTTALSLACGSLCASGRRIALLEADENVPLSVWRDQARRNGTWDERCEIYPAGDLSTLEASYAKAEQAGCEFVLVDTHGGGSELNCVIMIQSDLVVVPTAVTSYDINAALTTMQFAAELREAEESRMLIGLLVTKLPLNPTVSQREDLDAIVDLPLLETMLRERDAYSSMQRNGMLHLTCKKLRASPATRIASIHYRSAEREADALTADLLAVIEG